MEFLEQDLQSLIEQGKKQGFLTFEQVVPLPDAASVKRGRPSLVTGSVKTREDLLSTTPAMNSRVVRSLGSKGPAETSGPPRPR